MTEESHKFVDHYRLQGSHRRVSIWGATWSKTHLNSITLAAVLRTHWTLSRLLQGRDDWQRMGESGLFQMSRVKSKCWQIRRKVWRQRRVKECLQVYCLKNLKHKRAILKWASTPKEYSWREYQFIPDLSLICLLIPSRGIKETVRYEYKAQGRDRG